jgi:hypothetical protein
MAEARNEIEHAKRHQRQDDKRCNRFDEPKNLSPADVTLDPGHDHMDRHNDSENLPAGQLHVVV